MSSPGRFNQKYIGAKVNSFQPKGNPVVTAKSDPKPVKQITTFGVTNGANAQRYRSEQYKQQKESLAPTIGITASKIPITGDKKRESSSVLGEDPKRMTMYSYESSKRFEASSASRVLRKTSKDSSDLALEALSDNSSSTPNTPIDLSDTISGRIERDISDEVSAKLASSSLGQSYVNSSSFKSNRASILSHSPTYSSAASFHSVVSSMPQSNLQEISISELLAMKIRNSFHSRPKSTISKIGFENLGNTCYLNSVLQCILHVPAVAAVFEEQILRNSISSIGERDKSWLRKDLMTIFECLKNHSHTETQVAVRKFKGDLDMNVPQFSGFDQQDAHEFLCFILSSLHEEMNRCRVKYRISDWTEERLDAMNDVQKAKTIWNRFQVECSSSLFDALGGLLQSTVECSKCGTKTTTFDPFWNLSLPFPMVHHENHFHLNDCLQAFSKEEELSVENGILCSKCKIRVPCRKRLSVRTFPPVLVLHLKRFVQHSFRDPVIKLTSALNIPDKSCDFVEQLVSNSEVQRQRPDDLSNCVYTLDAVVCHYGSMNFGHYTAYVRSGSDANKWYHMNDDSVEIVEGSRFLENNTNAYILFYQRG